MPPGRLDGQPGNDDGVVDAVRTADAHAVCSQCAQRRQQVRDRVDVLVDEEVSAVEHRDLDGVGVLAPPVEITQRDDRILIAAHRVNRRRHLDVFGAGVRVEALKSALMTGSVQLHQVAVAEHIGIGALQRREMVEELLVVLGMRRLVAARCRGDRRGDVELPDVDSVGLRDADELERDQPPMLWPNVTIGPPRL